MEQETTKTCPDAKRALKQAKKKSECVGGRIIETGRGRQKRWVVQKYFVDDGSAPPVGMVRLILPDGTELATEYGIEPTLH